MKIILEFDCTDAEEKERGELAVRSVDFFLAVLSFSDWLREKEKYSEMEIPVIQVGYVRDKFNQCLNDHGVDMDMLS